MSYTKTILGVNMIIVIGGIKGGCGKTTLATNLTVMRSGAGGKVLLIDADEQNTASEWSDMRIHLGIETKWSTIRLSGKTIDFQIEKLKKDYDDIIVDVGGRDTTSQRSALLVADIAVIPFKPRSFDIWTIGKVKTLINEIRTVNKKLVCFCVINEADPSGVDNKQTLEILSQSEEMTCLDCVIGKRKAFGNAGSDGLGVAELKVVDKKAVQEIKDLYEKIYQN